MHQERLGTGLVMDSRTRSASSSGLSAQSVRLRGLALNEPSPRVPSVRPPSAREWPSCEVSLIEQPSHEPERGESGLDRSSTNSPLAGRGRPRCGFLQRCPRSQMRKGAVEPVLRRDSTALLDCKFATLNQLFGGDLVTGSNWCGMRWPLWVWWLAVPRRSREKLWREAAGARYQAPKQQSGTAGVGDVLNEARA
jgi:hypothetical protein